MNVYIVIESGGQYEDAWDANRFACATPEGAQAAIAAQKARREKLIAEREVLVAAKVAFEEVNPYPESISRLVIPRWEAGIRQQDITVEMREERNVLQAQNREIDRKNHEAHQAYYGALLAHQQTVAQTLGLEIPDRIVYSADIEYTKWSVEEMVLQDG